MLRRFLCNNKPETIWTDGAGVSEIKDYKIHVYLCAKMDYNVCGKILNQP